LIVDHALRAGSAKEAKAALKFSQSLGLETRLLTWKHDNPKTGLQEKARRARYGLMGEVCRKEGIRFLLTGHTQDDQAETLFMRYEKGTGWRGAAGMAEKTYAPVWPELAKVSILRPLLGVSRKSLRNYNQTHQLGWTEDPSNTNETFERVRTRNYLLRHPRLARQLLNSAIGLREGVNQENIRLIQHPIEIDELGIIQTSGSIPSRLLQHVLMVESGADRRVSTQQLADLKSNMGQPAFKSQTLGGTLCVKSDGAFHFGPDPGTYRGRHNKKPIGTTMFNAGETKIWAGRYEITAIKNTSENLRQGLNFIKTMPICYNQGICWRPAS